VRVDHEHGSRRASHAPNAAQGVVELLDLFAELAGLLLGQSLELAGVTPRLESIEALHAPLDGREVRQHAAEPAVVDVVLSAALRLGPQRLLRLLLGPDEQDAVPVPDRLADELQARRRAG